MTFLVSLGQNSLQLLYAICGDTTNFGSYPELLLEGLLQDGE